MVQAFVSGRPLAVPSTLTAVNRASCSLSHVAGSGGMALRAMGYSTIRSRHIHSSSKRPQPPTEASSRAASLHANHPPAVTTETLAEATNMARKAPLSILPLTTVLRTLGTTTISSSPLLLGPSLAIMSRLAHTSNPLLNPDKNPLLRFVMKKTFYAQFCAGENAAEVRQTVDGLKKIGFTGVLLGYAREVVMSESETDGLSASTEAVVANEVKPWAEGTMETVRIAQPGDFVSVKFSGAGRQALYALRERLPPPKELREAIDRICDLAKARDVPLLFDAEQDAIQAGIDDWTLDYQRRYNTTPNHAIVYGTYQAYLKSTPTTIAKHLAAAARDNFTLGVKLVRGAYLGSDPREIIHDTKEQTDECYDGVAEAVIRRAWNSTLKAPASAPDTAFPLVSLVLGSHNLESVRKARALRDSLPASEGVRELAIAQLMGMADEVSCELVAVKKADLLRDGIEKTRAYKYIVWGSTGECMKYLLRRAHENRDAVQRTRAGRDAMWAELKRRFWTRVWGGSQHAKHV